MRRALAAEDLEPRLHLLVRLGGGGVRLLGRRRRGGRRPRFHDVVERLVEVAPRPLRAACRTARRHGAPSGPCSRPPSRTSLRLGEASRARVARRRRAARPSSAAAPSPALRRHVVVVVGRGAARPLVLVVVVVEAAAAAARRRFAAASAARPAASRRGGDAAAEARHGEPTSLGVELVGEERVATSFRAAIASGGFAASGGVRRARAARRRRGAASRRRAARSQASRSAHAPQASRRPHRVDVLANSTRCVTIVLYRQSTARHPALNSPAPAAPRPRPWLR